MSLSAEAINRAAGYNPGQREEPAKRITGEPRFWRRLLAQRRRRGAVLRVVIGIIVLILVLAAGAVVLTTQGCETLGIRPWREAPSIDTVVEETQDKIEHGLKEAKEATHELVEEVKDSRTDPDPTLVSLRQERERLSAQLRDDRATLALLEQDIARARLRLESVTTAEAAVDARVSSKRQETAELERRSAAIQASIQERTAQASRLEAAVADAAAREREAKTRAVEAQQRAEKEAKLLHETTQALSATKSELARLQDQKLEAEAQTQNALDELAKQRLRLSLLINSDDARKAWEIEQRIKTLQAAETALEVSVQQLSAEVLRVAPGSATRAHRYCK